eukprot:441905-Hanusia_phi.AAC.4
MSHKQSRYIPVPVESSITYEDIAIFPRPGCSAPDSIAFSPDDSVVTYLASSDGSLNRQLYAMDIATGQVRELCKPPSGTGEEDSFSLEEKLRRERARQLHTGITSYAWAEGAEGAGKILVPIGNELFVQDGLNGELKRLFDPLLLLSEEQNLSEKDTNVPPILDARISSDGRVVGFVWDRELYLVSTDCRSKPVQLTSGARGTEYTNGLADYIAQEEMDRYEGYWISKDSSKIAFQQVDESHIPKYRIMHQGSDKVGDTAQEDHHYPFAGTSNPRVRFGIVNSDGSSLQWYDLTARFGEDIYLARVKWLPDNTVVIQIQNRDQTELELVRIFPDGQRMKTMFVEKSEYWINLHNMLTPLKGSDRIIWASERSGFQHLFLYDYDGNMLRQMTDGDWMVEDIKAVDEVRGLVCLSFSLPMSDRSDMCSGVLYWDKKRMEGPTFVFGLVGRWRSEKDNSRQWDAQRHYRSQQAAVCRSVQHVHLSFPRYDSLWIPLCFPSYLLPRYSSQPRFHTFLGTSLSSHLESSSHLLLAVNVCSLKDGAVVRSIFVNKDPRLDRLSLVTPVFVDFPSFDGKVTLQAAYLRPNEEKFGPGPYPTIVAVYGGPHVQTVSNSWAVTADLRSQFLCSQGYLVVKVDNRGSSRRGLHFESQVKWNMGHLEVEDQKAGVNFFVERGLADKDRVGIYGWSYGGYMSAMALARAPETFHVAIAGAPVTHWDGYDTHYTERYMGRPQDNSEGYVQSSVMTHVDQIEGSLLLVHGLIDENVHFRHTARLINALIRSQKHYELLLFPDERHSPRSLKDRVFMEQRIHSFIQRTLGPAR